MKSLAMFVALLPSLSAGVEGDSVVSIPAGGNAWHIAFGQITGDPAPELVYACYDGRVCCAQATGEIIWIFETGAFPYDLSVADINDDAKAETLVASADGRLYVISPDGKLFWRYRAEGPLYQVAVGRTDRDIEVFAGGVDRRLYVFHRSGSLLRSPDRNRAIRLIRAGDLTGDGKDEIVLGYGNGLVEALGGPELNEIWSKRQVEGDDPNGNPWRPFSLFVSDLDGDKSAEVIMGSNVQNGYGVRVLGGNGALKWEHREDARYRDGNDGIQTAVIACEIENGGTKEVVALRGSRLSIFSSAGKVLTTAVSPIAFSNICSIPSPGSFATLFLSSAPNGDDRIYRVKPDGKWRRQFARLKWEGKMRRIADNLDVIRNQVKSYEGGPPQDARYVYVITSGQPSTVDQLRSHGEMVEFYRRRFPYRCFVFATNIAMMSSEPVSGFGTEAYIANRLKPSTIPTLLKTLESSSTPFFLTIGHECQPFIDLKTAEAILKACPRSCLGFLSSEDEDYSYKLEHYLRDYWYPLMDLCKARGKKAILVEKGAWWVQVPAMERFRKLADGTYADVLVPSVEDANSRCPELNLVGQAGLFASGAVAGFCARTIDDEPCWNRFWEWEAVMTGQPFLRRQMAQALLGARFFDHRLPATTVQGRAQFNRIGQESVALIIDLLGKGLLVPPRPEEVMGYSPAIIRMVEPAPDFLKEGFNFHEHDHFSPDTVERESPFEGLACHWGAAPVQPNYIGAYLYGQDRHSGTFIPEAPFGLALIVPAFLDIKRLPWVKTTWETDGHWFYDRDQRLSGLDARARVEKSFKDLSQTLPFQLEGEAFMQAQKLGSGHYRVTLIDPGFVDPADRLVTVRIRTDLGVTQASDALAGTPLKVLNGAITLPIPAGAFRIVDVRE